MADIKEIKDLVGIRITTVNLNNKSFLLWENFVVFLDMKGKLKIITSAKFASAEWERDNYLAMT